MTVSVAGSYKRNIHSVGFVHCRQGDIPAEQQEMEPNGHPQHGGRGLDFSSFSNYKMIRSKFTE